jgi:hypothetical protein
MVLTMPFEADVAHDDHFVAADTAETVRDRT